MSHKKTGYKKFDLMPVILSRLTTTDFDYLGFVGINHSGSTGPHVEGYELGPYLATYLYELPRALEAMGWHRMKMWYANGQIIVRRRR